MVKILYKDCAECGEGYPKKSNVSRENWARSRFCSKQCSIKQTSIANQPSWAKANAGTGVIKANSGSFKKGQNVGSSNVNWKGDQVGYRSLHSWIRREYGMPTSCEDCGTTKKGKYEWANISGKYLRERSDWKHLCRFCHKEMDWELLPRGESHPMAKLNDQKVKLIRLMNSEFSWSIEKIHEIFGEIWGVTIYAIKDVATNRSWTHVT